MSWPNKVIPDFTDAELVAATNANEHSPHPEMRSHSGAPDPGAQRRAADPPAVADRAAVGRGAVGAGGGRALAGPRGDGLQDPFAAGLRGHLPGGLRLLVL
ncbi:hypothetical protein PUR71_00305, partial [Streptomyces sp. SP17BM10]|uniref:hypothetical protein n=1 Tax=Streptomyces sp. SP17BM10 TaxID=3002530 RepID=UPI002E779D65